MDLIKMLHESELFNDALSNLSEDEKKTIAAHAEMIIADLADVIKEASLKGEVVTEVNEEPEG